MALPTLMGVWGRFMAGSTKFVFPRDYYDKSTNLRCDVEVTVWLWIR